MLRLLSSEYEEALLEDLGLKARKHDYYLSIGLLCALLNQSLLPIDQTADRQHGRQYGLYVASVNPTLIELSYPIQLILDDSICPTGSVFCDNH